MKKFILMSALGVLMFSGNVAQALELYDAGYTVTCLRGNRVCSVGEFTMSTNGKKPLIVENGIVCTPDRRICTNGYYVLRTNKTRYV